MDISEFSNLRREIIDGYHDLENLSAQLGNEHVKSELHKGENSLMEDKFKLVVVGEFSRGKSTFINALLGQRILPAKSDPTTTTINRISYGESKKFILHYRDATPDVEISESEFKDITAENVDEESSNESVARSAVSRIAYAEIHYPLEICKNGIEIIDTPGTNDLDQVREEITFNFIPEADAAIILLDAEQLLSASEIDFLKERVLENDISKIFFVINFKDRLYKHKDPLFQGQRILKTAETELTKYVSNPRVYLVSSKLALNFRLARISANFKGKVPDSFEETGFGDFEHALAEYLVKEKSADKLKKYVRRAVHLSDDLIAQTIRVEESSLGLDSAQLQRQVEQLKPHLERVKYEAHRLFDDLDFRLKKIVENSTLQYELGLEKISRQAQRSLNSYSGELRAESVAHAIELVVAPLQQQNELSIRNEITDRLEEEMRTVRQRLQTIFKEETKNQQLVIAKDESSRSLIVANQSFTLDHVSTEDSALIGGGLILGGLAIAVNIPFIAIPAVIFGGKYFLQQFENYRRENFLSKVSIQIRERYATIIPQQVRQFESVVNAQLTTLVDSFKQEIDGKISAVEKQLDRLLSERSRTIQNENARRAELKSYEQRIKNIQRKLEKLA